MSNRELGMHLLQALSEKESPEGYTDKETRRRRRQQAQEEQ